MQKSRGPARGFQGAGVRSGGGGQGGCEPRIGVIVKMQKRVGGLAGGVGW